MASRVKMDEVVYFATWLAATLLVESFYFFGVDDADYDYYSYSYSYYAEDEEDEDEDCDDDFTGKDDFCCY